MNSLLDLLTKTKLFELAYERKKSIEKIDNLSYQISFHLLKLLIFTSSTSTQHWLKEVNGWLREIDRIRVKPKNKKLSKNDYLKYLKTPYLENENQMKLNIQSLVDEYREETPVNISSQDITKTINTILDKICYEISTNTFTYWTIEDLEIKKHLK